MNNLKKLRKEMGIRQRELAEEIKISVRTLQSYEQGSRELRNANFNTIRNLCYFFGVTPSELLNQEESKLQEELRQKCFDYNFENKDKKGGK